MRLLTEMSELVPAIDEANAICEDLDKRVHFQLVLIPPQFQAIGHEKSKAKTKVRGIERTNHRRGIRKRGIESERTN